MRHSLAGLAISLLLTLTACSSLPEGGPDTVDQKLTADELYAKSKTQMQDGEYEQAVKSLERLQSRYPYGRYAQQAQLDIAYAWYKKGESAPALSALERFNKQFPKSDVLDYALYLKGIINFDENLNSYFSTLFKQDPAERDPVTLRASFDAFKQLINRYPQSRYTEDARQRMQYLLVTLAKHEIDIASYYLRRGAYVAAVNRAQGVLTDFPDTPQTRDALQIMVQGYSRLGLNDLSRDTQRVLDLNIAKDGLRPSVAFFQEEESPWWKFWE